MRIPRRKEQEKSKNQQLCEAAFRGDLKTCRELLDLPEERPDVDARLAVLPLPEDLDLNGSLESKRTALMCAIMGNCNPAIVELLLERKADVNARTAAGLTPMHYLCSVSQKYPKQAPLVYNIMCRYKPDLTVHNSRVPKPFQLAGFDPRNLGITQAHLSEAARVGDINTCQALLTLPEAMCYEINATVPISPLVGNLDGENDWIGEERTALMWAIAGAGNPEIIKLLLESRAEINYVNRFGWSAMHYLCRLSRSKSELALQIYNIMRPFRPLFNLNIISEEKPFRDQGMNPQFLAVKEVRLCEAAYRGDLKTCETLLNLPESERPDIDTQSANIGGVFEEGTPLTWAILGDANLELIKLLLKKGADVNKTNHLGWSTMHFLCDISHKLPPKAFLIFKILRLHKPNLNLKNTSGHAPFQMPHFEPSHFRLTEVTLSEAARLGDLEMCQALLGLPENKRPDVNTRVSIPWLDGNPDGENVWTSEQRTPLMWAIAGTCNPVIVKFLLENKADINAVNQHGWSPMHFLCRASNKFPEQAVLVYNIMITYKPNFNLENTNGHKPFQVEGYNPEFLPIAEGTRGLIKDIDHDKFFKVPDRLAQIQKGASKEEIEKYIATEKNWWHDFYVMLADKIKLNNKGSCDYGRLSDLIKGCRIHFMVAKPSKPSDLDSIKGDYIWVEAKNELYHVTPDIIPECHEIKLNYADFKVDLENLKKPKEKTDWMALTFEQVEKLIVANGGPRREYLYRKSDDPKKAQEIQNEQKAHQDFMDNLKFIYAIVRRYLGNISESTVQTYIADIADRIGHCDEGVLKRVKEIGRQQSQPQDFYELLFQLRKSLLTDIKEKYSEHDVHNRARFESIASVGYAVPTTHAGDTHHGRLWNVEIANFLLNEFNETLRFYPLSRKLTDELIGVLNDPKRDPKVGEPIITRIADMDILTPNKSLNIAELIADYVVMIQKNEKLSYFGYRKEGYKRAQYVGFKNDIIKICCRSWTSSEDGMLETIEFKDSDLFIIENEIYYCDLNLQFIEKLIQKKILEEKLFTKEYKPIISHDNIILYAHDEDDIADFFQYSNLTFQQYKIFLAKYLAQSSEIPQSNILNKLLRDALLKGDIERSNFLLTLGADPNHPACVINQDSVDKFNGFYESLTFDWLHLKGYSRPKEEKAKVEVKQEPKIIFPKYEHPKACDFIMYSYEKTPLMIAISSGNLSSLQFLLTNGAHVNKGNRYGWTALHHLAYLSYTLPHVADDMLRLLLEHGADVHAKTVKSETIKGCDLSLMSVKDEKQIDQSILTKSQKDGIPILIQKGNEYLIYGDSKGDGNWKFTKITSDISYLKDLPFENGILRRSDEKFTASLINTLEEGHAPIKRALIPSDVAPELSPFRIKLLREELHHAVRAGEIEDVKVIIGKGGEIDIDKTGFKAKISFEPKLKTEKHFFLETKRHYQEVKALRQAELKDINHKINKINADASVLFEINLLVQNIALTGYICPKNYSPVARLIVALLQTVFHQYPLYSFADMNNQSIPEGWKNHVNQILNKIELKELDRIDEKTFKRIVAAINEEYKSDGIQIQARLHQRMDVFSSEEIAANCVKVQIYQFDDLFLVPQSTETCYTKKEQAVELLKNLELQGGLLNSVILHRIKSQLKSFDLTTAPIENLQQFLQTEIDSFDPINRFSKLAEFFKLEIPTDAVFDLARSIAETLSQYEEQKVFSQYEIDKKLAGFHHIYLNALRSTIQAEFARRRVDINRLLSDDPIKRLEQQINQKIQEIENTDKELEEKSSAIKAELDRLKKLEAKSNQLEQSYAEQLEQINLKIKFLDEDCQNKKKLYEALKNQHQQANEKAQQDDKEFVDNQAELEKLRMKKGELEVKRQQIRTEIDSLNKALVDLEAESQKLTLEKNNLEKRKSAAELQAKVMAQLFSFAQGLKKVFATNGALFKNKAKWVEVRTRCKELLGGAQDRFGQLYDYLTKQSEFQHLVAKDIEDIIPHADCYFDEYLTIINNILGVPILTTVSDAESVSVTIKGYNLSWDECNVLLQNYVNKQLADLGLKIIVDEKQHKSMVVAASQYAPSIVRLPAKLKLLITERVHAKIEPDPYPTPENDPVWRGLENSETLAAWLRDKLDITFEDVLPCLVPNLEIIAGNDIFIESDIRLPGVNVNLHANGNIDLKPDCKIITSPNCDAPKFVSIKARDGADPVYSKGEPPRGRGGDDGLCGLAGCNAGHIYLRANLEIKNLSTLCCEAKGGRGADGQIGGDGEQGRTGPTTPAALADPLPKSGWSGSSAMIIAEAREPGVSIDGRILKEEKSGPGGLPGRAGWGGDGGLRGDIIIDDRLNQIHFIDDKEVSPIGANIGVNLESRMQRKHGDRGIDAKKELAKGGKPGEPGFKGTPMRRIKKWEDADLPVFGGLFGEWVYSEDFANYDIKKYKELFAGLYTQTDWKENYSHQYSSTWYREDLPIAERVQQSLDARSLGEDRSRQQSEMCSRRKHNQATKNANRAKDQQYRQSLQDQASKLSEQAEIKKSQQRIDEENRIEQEINAYKEKIGLCETAINQKSTQIGQVKHAVTEKNNILKELEVQLQKISEQIQKAETEGQQIAADLLKARDIRDEVAAKMKQAEKEAAFAEFDKEAEVGVKADLAQERNRLSKMVLDKQEATLATLQTFKSLKATLLKLKVMQQDELTKLQLQHQLLIDERNRLKKNTIELDQAIENITRKIQQKMAQVEQHEIKLEVKHQSRHEKTKKKPLSFSIPRKPGKHHALKQIAARINHLYKELKFEDEKLDLAAEKDDDAFLEEMDKFEGTADKAKSTSPSQAAGKANEKDCLDEKDRYLRDFLEETKAEDYPEVADMVDEYSVPPIEIMVNLSQTRIDKLVQNATKTSSYRKLLIALNEWIKQVDSFEKTEIIYLWESLYDIVLKFDITKEEYSKIIPLYEELSFQMHRKSMDTLLKEVKDGQLALDNLFYTTTPGLKLNIVENVRFRKYFFRYFITTGKDVKISRERLLHDLSKFPAIYFYSNKEQDQQQITQVITELEDSLIPEMKDEKIDIDKHYFAICKTILDRKAKRLHAQLRSKDAKDSKELKESLAESHSQYDVFNQIFFDKPCSLITAVKNSNIAKGDILDRLHSFLIEEYCELINFKVIPELQQMRTTPTSLATRLVDLTMKVSSLYNEKLNDLPEFSYSEGQLTGWLDNLKFESTDWAAVLMALNNIIRQGIDGKNAADFIRYLILEKINIFKLDEKHDDVCQVKTMMDDLHITDQRPLLEIVENFAQEAILNWTQALRKYKSKITTDKEYVEVNHALQDIISIMNATNNDASPQDQLRPEDQLRRLKLIDHILQQYLTTFDRKLFLESLATQKKLFIQQTKRKLFEIARPDTKEYQTEAYPDILKNMTEYKTADMERFLFCLEQDKDTFNLDMVDKLTLEVISQQNRTLSLSSKEKVKDSLSHLNRINDFIDQRLLKFITDKVIQSRDSLKPAIKRTVNIEDQLKNYEDYFRQGKNKREVDEEPKKNLVRLLLTKLQQWGDTDDYKDIDSLIKAHNAKGLVQLIAMPALALFEYKHESKAPHFADKVLTLKNQIKSDSGADAIFKVWLPVLQLFVELLQSSSPVIEAWMMPFIDHSTCLLQNLIFNAKDQQEMHYIGKQLAEVSLKLHLLNAAEPIIHPLNHFSKRLQAYSFKPDLHRNIDILIKDFEQSDEKTTSLQLLTSIEYHLPQLNNLFKVMRLKGGSEQNPIKLTRDIIGQLTTDSLKKQPKLCVQNIEKIISDTINQLKETNAKGKEQSTYLVDLFNKAIQGSSPEEVRRNFSQIYLCLMFNKYKMEDIAIFYQQLLNLEKQKVIKNEIFLLDIYNTLSEKYSLDLIQHCQKDDVLKEWIKPLLQLSSPTKDHSHELFVTLVKLSSAIKNKSPLDTCISEIVKVCFQQDSLLNLFTHVLSSALSDKKLTDDHKSLLSFINRLLPFSESKIQVLEDGIKLLFSEFNAGNLPRDLNSILINLMIEKSYFYIEKNIQKLVSKKHLKVLVANLAEESQQSGEINKEMLGELFCLSEELRNHNEVGSKQNIIDIILNKYPKIGLSLFLSSNEKLYAEVLIQKSDSSFLGNVIKENFGNDYLKKLKSLYWQQIIYTEFYARFGKKELKCQGIFIDFLTTDEFRRTEKFYDDLKSQLRDSKEILDDLETIFLNKKLLTTSHSIAVANRSEKLWLEFVSQLCKHHQKGLGLTQINQILDIAHHFDDLTILLSIAEKSDSSQLSQLIIFEFLTMAVNKKIPLEEKNRCGIINQLKDKIFSTPLGLQFIYHFSKAVNACNDAKIKLFTAENLNQLLDIIIKVGVHQDPDLINDLKNRPLNQWAAVLKRRHFAIRLNLGKDHNPILENLISLQRKNSALVEKWVNKVETFDPIDYKSLNNIFINFARQEWKFNDAAYNLIEIHPMNKWDDLLKDYFDTGKAQQKAIDEKAKHGRDAKQLIEIMKKDTSGINNGIPNLLSPKPFQESLEKIIYDSTSRDDSKLIDESKSIYQRLRESYKAKNKEEIKQEIIKKAREFNVLKRAGSGPHTFLKNDFSVLNDEVKYKEFIKELKEFLAYMMLAVEEAEGFSIRDNQLIALISFVNSFDKGQGLLANISTGEGKTLITRMLAIVCALRGEIVDVITSSKALAEPQAREAKRLFEYFDLKVDNICDDACERDENERRKRYEENTVLYGEVSSFQRDALLTEFYGKNIRRNPSQRLIVDEMDVPLIDQTDKVLYISHSIHDLLHLRSLFLFIWQGVNSRDTARYSIRNVESIIELLQNEKAKGAINIPPHLQEFVTRRLPTWIKNAYLAKFMGPDQEYSIMPTDNDEEKPVINDLPTGVEQFNSQWNNGLHQFVQLKHHKALSNETLRAIFISNVSYFNRYRSLGGLWGMTGTIGSKNERDLMTEVYGVKYFRLPRFKCRKYTHREDIIVSNREDWQKAILDDVDKEVIKSSRATLIICKDKDTANKLDRELKRVLADKKVRIYLYVSYTTEGLKLETGEVQPGDIIISTNLSGRGQDLIISEKLKQNGGMHLQLTYMPSNIRIEKQAFGRVARNGQPGSGKFIIEDERAEYNPDISIEELRDERDELERIRLEEIKQIKIKRLDAEQHLSELFGDFQREIKETLTTRSISGELINLQIRSLHNAWAFWFDEKEEALEKIYQTGKDLLLTDFDNFKNQIRSRLDQSPEMLVVEPAELMNLAKYHMNNKEYNDAVRCYEKCIQLNPDFSGYAHYYLAQAFICIGNDEAHKKRARNAFKKSIFLFQKEVSRLSTANEIIRVISNQMIQSGQALTPDIFSKTNIDEIGMYQIHMQAAKEAIGYELKPECFQTGEIVGDEVKTVFKNLRTSDKFSEYIKDFRVSKHAKIMNEELYYKDQKFNFSLQFDYCKQAIIRLFKEKTSQADYNQRKLNPRDLAQFILTAEKFENKLKNIIESCEVISLPKDSKLHLRGSTFWENAVFSGHGFKIKNCLIEFSGKMIKNDFLQFIKKDLKDIKEIDWAAIYKHLIDSQMVISEKAYVFKNAADEKKINPVESIKNYKKSFILQNRSDIKSGIQNLPLDTSVKLIPYIEKIRLVLIENINKNTLFTKESFNIESDELFEDLFSLMQRYGLLENRLPKILNLEIDEGHCRLIEETILFCAQKGHFVLSDLLLPQNEDESISVLWSQLLTSGIVRNPVVNFPLDTDSETEIRYRLDEINNKLSKHIDSLIRGISRFERAQSTQTAAPTEGDAHSAQDSSPESSASAEAAAPTQYGEDVIRLKTAVFEALEKSIGKLRTLHKVKLENRNVGTYFNPKIPPIIVEYMRTVYADVLNLILDQEEEGWDWDAFLCAMIGVAQIVAGAMIVACCPAAAYFGEALISEGISDITFAVTSAIEGNFSWDAYYENKVRSLAISLATAGVGAALNGAREGAEGLKVSSHVAKQLAMAAVQVAADVSINMAMSNLSEKIVAALFEDFNKNFKKEVTSRNGVVLNIINQQIEMLYNKASPSQMETIIQECVSELSMQKVIDGEVYTKAFQAVESVTNKLAGLKQSNSADSSLNKLISVASIISKILEVESYAAAISDIYRTPTVLFDELNNSLKRRVTLYSQQKDLAPIPLKELSGMVEKKIDQIVSNILNQIQAQVQRVFTRLATKGANLALASVIDKAKTFLSERIEEFYAEPKVAQGQADLKAAQSLSKPETEQMSHPEDGSVFKDEDLASQEISEIQTEQGSITLKDLKALSNGDPLHITVKDGEYYLLESEFSGDSRMSDLKVSSVMSKLGIFALIDDANRVKDVPLDWSSMSKHKGDAAHRIRSSHMKINLQREFQSIFYGDPVDKINQAWETVRQQKTKPLQVRFFDKDINAKVRVGDLYHVPFANAGYGVGYGSGQRVPHDYITIINLPDSNHLIEGRSSTRTPLLPEGYQFSGKKTWKYKIQVASPMLAKAVNRAEQAYDYMKPKVMTGVNGIAKVAGPIFKAFDTTMKVKDVVTIEEAWRSAKTPKEYNAAMQLTTSFVAKETFGFFGGLLGTAALPFAGTAAGSLGGSWLGEQTVNLLARSPAKEPERYKFPYPK